MRITNYVLPQIFNLLLTKPIKNLYFHLLIKYNRALKHSKNSCLLNTASYEIFAN